jgi:hypothetical protein
MNIPIGSVISFTHYHPYNGNKYDLIGEYVAGTASKLSMVIIKVLDGPRYKKDNGQYFPIDVLDTAIILYPNVTTFYNENPEYLL